MQTVARKALALLRGNREVFNRDMTTSHPKNGFGPKRAHFREDEKSLRLPVQNKKRLNKTASKKGHTKNAG